jgi:hypothetical protein
LLSLGIVNYYALLGKMAKFTLQNGNKKALDWQLMALYYNPYKLSAAIGLHDRYK